jgi:hypothetical protein
MKVHAVNTTPVEKVKLQGSKGVKEREAKDSSKAKIDTTDMYIPSKSDSETAVYTRPVEAKAESSDIQSLRDESNRAFGQLRETVRQLLERQGLAFKDVNGLHLGAKVDAQAKAEAQAMLEEGGAFSAEAVSDKIIDFAKAISGGDKSKIDTLRKAIDRGFKEAGKAWDGDLPEITKQTRKMIDEKLDAWQNEV